MPRGPIASLRQPWVFAYWAVGFGVLTYLIQGISVWTAIVGGIAFGLLMSVWTELRRRRRQAASNQ